MSSIDVGFVPAPALATTFGDGRPALRAAADRLEVTFLAEMLKAAKFGEPPPDFGGGTGEDQFTSFLRNAHADAVVAAGGIGLAEQLFRSLAGETTDGR